jgi:hypothetical protein
VVKLNFYDIARQHPTKSLDNEVKVSDIKASSFRGLRFRVVGLRNARENTFCQGGHVGAMIALAVARPVIGSTEESGTWCKCNL